MKKNVVKILAVLCLSVLSLSPCSSYILKYTIKYSSTPDPKQDKETGLWKTKENTLVDLQEKDPSKQSSYPEGTTMPTIPGGTRDGFVEITGDEPAKSEESLKKLQESIDKEVKKIIEEKKASGLSSGILSIELTSLAIIENGRRIPLSTSDIILNSYSLGDPVIATTGQYAHSEIDLTIQSGHIIFNIERNYQSDNKQGRSLGLNWQNSLDSVVLRGLKPTALMDVEEIETIQKSAVNEKNKIIKEQSAFIKLINEERARCYKNIGLHSLFSGYDQITEYLLNYENEILTQDIEEIIKNSYFLYFNASIRYSNNLYLNEKTEFDLDNYKEYFSDITDIKTILKKGSLKVLLETEYKGLAPEEAFVEAIRKIKNVLDSFDSDLHIYSFSYLGDSIIQLKELQKESKLHSTQEIPLGIIAVKDIIAQFKSQISTLDTEYNTYIPVYTSRKAIIDRQLIIISNAYTKAKNEYNHYASNFLKNTTVGHNSNKNLINTGNDTFILIDEGGVPHIYAALSKPSYNGEFFYPEGTLTQSLNINDKIKFSLLKNGSYTCQRGLETWIYNSKGQLEYITNIYSDTLHFIYNDETKQLDKITTSNNQEYIITWTNGLIETIRGQEGQKVTYGYTDGHLTSVQDVDGDTVSYTYTAEGNIHKIIKPDNSFVELVYGKTNTEGKPLVTRTRHEEQTHIDPNSSAPETFGESFDYDFQNKTTTYTNHSGLISTIKYDEKFRTVEEHLPEGISKFYSYDLKTGYLSKLTINGTVTSYTYDSRGNKTSALYEDSSTEEWKWNKYDEMVYYKDRDGYALWRVYNNERTNLSIYKGKKVESRKLVLTETYNIKGQLLTSKNQGRGVYTYTYDSSTGFLKTRSITVNGILETEKFDYDALGRMISYTDAKDRTWTYTYKKLIDENKVVYGRLVIENTPDKLERIYEYNSRKDLVKIIESDQFDLSHIRTRTTSIAYDKRHLPIKIATSDGAEIVYTYRADGKKKSEKRGPWETTYDYAPLTGYLSKITRLKTEENGSLTQYTETYNTKFDLEGKKVVTVEGASPFDEVNAINAVLNYDDWGNIVSRTNALKEQSERKFTPAGRLDEEQTASGGFLTYDYEPTTGRLSSLGKKNEKQLAVTYFEDGNIKTKTDRNGFVINYEYNEKGLLKEESSLAGKKTYTYDKAGRVTKVETSTTSPQNLSTVNSFTTWEYNDSKRTVTVTEGGLYKTIWTKNSWGEPVKKQDAQGNTFTWEYNGVGKLVKAFDAYNRITEYEWNELGKVSKILYPDSNFQEYDYDHLGNVLEIRDSMGVSWNGTYNASGLLSTETSRPGIDKAYTYDSLGRIASVSSGKEIVESYEYESRGKTVTKIDGKEVSFTYQKDMYGILTDETNRLGMTKTYTYDDEGQVCEIQEYSGKTITIQTNPITRTQTTRYDDDTTITLYKDYAMRIVKAESSTGVIEYAYDAGGKLISQEDHVAGETILYYYNASGQRIRMTGGNRDVHYTYGKNGELSTIFDYSQGLSIVYSYDSMGRETRRKYGNGGSQHTIYDGAGRTILVREVSAFGELLRAEGYIYDSKGRRKATVNESGCVTRYEYNGQSQISSILYPLSEAIISADEEEAKKAGVRIHGALILGDRYMMENAEYAECVSLMELMGFGRSRMLSLAHSMWRQTFTYDANGNRLTKASAWGKITYCYDDENHLMNMGSTHFAYDADGNLLSETSPLGVKTFQYTGSNRMKESRVVDYEIKQEVLTSYAYDAFGRRTLVADDGGEVMRTLYDGLSFEIFREGLTFADNSFTTNGVASSRFNGTGCVQNGRYVYIDDEDAGRASLTYDDSITRVAVRYTGESVSLYVCGERVAMNRSGNKDTSGGRGYFGTDVLGSVRSVTGEDSVIQDRYEYDAFGVPYAGDFSTGLNAGYTGKPYDSTTGLYNYGYRDYSPTTARFTTVDPIRDGTNWFAYVNNDPVNFIDEWGLIDYAVMTYNRKDDSLTVEVWDDNKPNRPKSTKVYDNVTNDFVTSMIEYDPDHNKKTDNSYFYYPEEFPDSPPEGWKATRTYESKDPRQGPTISTDAHRTVTTYDAQGNEIGSVDDTGYADHGGTGTKTWGCIKSADEEVRERMKIVNDVINSGGEARYYTKSGEKND